MIGQRTLRRQWWLMKREVVSEQVTERTVERNERVKEGESVGKQALRYDRQLLLETAERRPVFWSMTPALSHNLQPSVSVSIDHYLRIMSYRATPNGTGFSPSKLLMGRKLRTRLPTLDQLLKPRLINSNGANSKS